MHTNSIHLSLDLIRTLCAPFSFLFVKIHRIRMEDIRPARACVTRVHSTYHINYYVCMVYLIPKRMINYNKNDRSFSLSLSISPTLAVFSFGIFIFRNQGRSVLFSFWDIKNVCVRISMCCMLKHSTQWYHKLFCVIFTLIPMQISYAHAYDRKCSFITSIFFVSTHIIERKICISDRFFFPSAGERENE